MLSNMHCSVVHVGSPSFSFETGAIKNNEKTRRTVNPLPPADTESRWRLHSASSTILDVRCTRLSTVGDRAFPVAAARLWNSLSSHVTLFLSSAVVLNHISSQISYPCFFSHRYSARAVTRHFGHYNRFDILHLTFSGISWICYY